MSDFDTVNALASTWADDNLGTAFTFASDATTLYGVFNQPTTAFQMEEIGTRREVHYVCVTDKAQWIAAGLTPANRATVTTDSITYTIDAIDGLNSTGEPAYTLYLRLGT